MSGPQDDSGRSTSRLSILGLLAWTLATAVGIRVYQLIPPILGNKFGYLPQVYVCVMGFALGTLAVGCTFLFLTHRVRNTNWQPGHWMLMLGVASAISNGIAIGVVAAYISPDSSYRLKDVHLAQFTMFAYGPHSFWLVQQSVAWGLGTVAAVFWFRQLRRRVTIPWSVVAFLFVATAATIFSGNLVALFRMKFTVSTGPFVASPIFDSWLFWWLRWWCLRSGHVFATSVVACSIAILLAITCDVSRCLRRDWLHWMGVGTWLVVATIQLITFSVIHLTL